MAAGVCRARATQGSSQAGRPSGQAGDGVRQVGAHGLVYRHRLVDQGAGLRFEFGQAAGEVDPAEERARHGEGHLVEGVLRLGVRPDGTLFGVTAVGAEAAMGA